MINVNKSFKYGMNRQFLVYPINEEEAFKAIREHSKSTHSFFGVGCKKDTSRESKCEFCDKTSSFECNFIYFFSYTYVISYPRKTKSLCPIVELKLFMNPPNPTCL